MTPRQRPLKPIAASSMLGFVVGTSQLSWQPATVRVVEACSRAATAQNAGLGLVMDLDVPNEALRNLTSDGRMAGVLIRARAASHSWVRELASAGVPTVLLGAHQTMPDVHSVEVENVESTASLVGTMLDAGCERLAMITGPADYIDANQRLEGYRLAHIQRGRSCDPSMIFSGDFTRRSAYDVADEILGLRPDGVFAANDEMARGFMERATQFGVSVPDDMMMAGFDGIGDYSVDRHELASVHQPFDEWAMVAIETLLGLVRGMDMPLRRLVDPTIHLGTTVPWQGGFSARFGGDPHPIERISLRSVAHEGLA